MNELDTKDKPQKNKSNIQKSKTWMKHLLSKFPVYITQIKTMEMLIHYITTGDYIFYTTGKITKDNCLELADHFENIYHVNDSKDVRYMKKKADKSNCMLVIFAKPETDYLTYWLLSTKGQGLFFKINQYKNVFKKSERITLVDNYELANYENPVTNKMTFSWRLNDERYREILGAGVDAIKYNHNETLKNLCLEVQKLRGFSLVRRQYVDFIRVWYQTLRSTHKKITTLEEFTGLEKIKKELPKFKKVTETRNGVAVDLNLFDWYNFQLIQIVKKSKKDKILSSLKTSEITESDIEKENKMAILKQKKPAKVKFTMQISKDLFDELQAVIASVPATIEIDFDDYAKKMIKEIKAGVEDYQITLSNLPAATENISE